jgi:hypothetical protein
MHMGMGRKLHGVDHGHGRKTRDEHNGAIIIDRPAYRVPVLLAGLLVVAVAMLMLVDVAASRAEPMPVGVPGTWELKLNEEFTSTGLNTALWTPGWQSGASISGPVSNECLASKNVSQSGNGYLYLQVRKEHATCGTTTVEDTGGLIESNPSDGQPGHSGFSYTYGVVEWEAYVPGVSPTGRGCPKGGCLPDWPALWSLSSTNADEIDTMEGLETLGQACYHIHPPPGSEGPGSCLSGSYASAWHKYASEWEPGVVKFFYDGSQVGELSSGILNGTPQYLIADMVPPGCCNQPLVVPDEMVVNYVRVWQHLSPPTATTEAASSVSQFQTTLNGSVNPHHADTHFYFEYGETTSYGYSTSHSDAGSGGTEVHESATIGELQPGLYHYRLVATNEDGTTYGGDDTFTVSPAATTGEASEVGESGATLRGTVAAEGLTVKYYFQYGTSVYYGSTTAEHTLGSHGAEPVSIRVTGLEPNAVYHYRLVVTTGSSTSYGKDRTLTTLPTETRSTWTIRDPDSADTWVYYVNSGHEVTEWAWNAGEGKWHNGTIGGSAATGTSTTVVRDPVSGDVWVYYANSSHEIAEWSWNAGESRWHNGVIGGSVAAETTPSVVRDRGSGDVWVYYVNSSNQIAEWSWNAGEGKWHNGAIGGSVAAGTSPAVVRDPVSDDVWVYYANSSHEIAEWNWNTGEGKWHNGAIGGSVATGTSPSVLRSLISGDVWVYYVNGSNQIAEWAWNAGEGHWYGGVL